MLNGWLFSLIKCLISCDKEGRESDCTLKPSNWINASFLKVHDPINRLSVKQSAAYWVALLPLSSGEAGTETRLCSNGSDAFAAQCPAQSSSAKESISIKSAFLYDKAGGPLSEESTWLTLTSSLGPSITAWVTWLGLSTSPLISWITGSGPLDRLSFQRWDPVRDPVGSNSRLPPLAFNHPVDQIDLLRLRMLNSFRNQRSSGFNYEENFWLEVYITAVWYLWGLNMLSLVATIGMRMAAEPSKTKSPSTMWGRPSWVASQAISPSSTFHAPAPALCPPLYIMYSDIKESTAGLVPKSGRNIVLYFQFLFHPKFRVDVQVIVLKFVLLHHQLFTDISYILQSLRVSTLMIWY